MLFARKKRQIVRLLVVEDEPLVAFDNEHLLTEANFEVVATVDRVVDAVRVVDGEPGVDLVLVDANLADGSGVDVARAAHARGTAVLFVTGRCPPEAATLADGCLAKPYSPRDLLQAIAAVEARRDGRPVKKLPSGLTLFDRDA